MIYLYSIAFCTQQLFCCFPPGYPRHPETITFHWQPFRQCACGFSRTTGILEEINFPRKERTTCAQRLVILMGTN
uniref:Putative secreted protein n=1 Tax=Anopheles darlingi TaxID=43151 RepID=A0A2M4DM67_ANODA